MRVLVTGGAGYIGSHALRALRRRGHDVIAFDNFSTGHAYLAGAFPLIVGDVRDYACIRRAMQGVDAVVHFAASAYVGESVEQPRKYFDNNVRGGLALLDAMLDAHVRKIVFSSTCATYGEPSAVPISEDTPQQPINAYGASKLTIEHALRAYSTAYGLRSVSLRYFNVAGADFSGDIGEDHYPETHVIPLALAAARGDVDQLHIFGNDYPTADGTCVRDYIHVCDVADAHVAALDYLAAGGGTTALNLGTGAGTSVLELIAAVEKVAGTRVPTSVRGRRPGDAPELIADPARAAQLLHWRAKHTLAQMVETAWKWYNQRAARKAVASAPFVFPRASGRGNNY